MKDDKMNHTLLSRNCSCESEASCVGTLSSENIKFLQAASQ